MKAWVTLATNDSYALGAIVLARSLRSVNTEAQLVCLVCNKGDLSENIVDSLSVAFDEIVETELISSDEPLIDRPELRVTFTKINCWRLVQYEKCVFLDADTLVIQNCDELFEAEELSAAPDIGWPDCFNSGLFVFRPSEDKFNELKEFIATVGSFDGGDQGLLNSFFANTWHRLSFIYNTAISIGALAMSYTYLPALKHFGHNIKIVHFLGAVKPWHTQGSSGSPTQKYLDQWWTVFNKSHSRETVPALSIPIPTVSAPTSATPKLTEPSLEAWQLGQMDYMGVDCFENILNHIEQTLKIDDNKPLTPLKVSRSPSESKSHSPSPARMKRKSNLKK